MADPKIRCAWANSDPLLARYHDKEWGVPVHRDRVLFEMLNLEGAQAGLSWLIVLRKRSAYRLAFDGFDAGKITRYDAAKKKALLKNEGIVRNRLKINAVVENAKAFLTIQRDCGSFDRFIWRFVEGKTTAKAAAVAASEAMSKSLKEHGFRFVGPTICHAFMQATGMVNDHEKKCFRYKALC